MLLGCIADDLTGATDLSLMLSREGLRTVQSTGLPGDDLDLTEVDALVVALKSRTIPAADAVAQSLAAAEWLLANGAQRLFFKYCSTFDSTDEGNIGPVAEALLKRLDAGFTIACPAFPATGRSIYQGHLFVNGVPLNESSMRDHPLTPMRDSDLRRVLQRQTELPVGLVAYADVDAGAEAIAEAFAREQAAGKRIAIVDALQDAHLREIGKALVDVRLITGGSGIAIGLPTAYRDAGLIDRLTPPAASIAAPEGRGAILAGSCSAATRGQVAKAQEAGLPTLRIDPLEIASGKLTPASVIEWLVSQPADATPLVYSSDDPDSVRAVQEKLGRDKAGTLVEDLLASVAAALPGKGFTRLLVAGGETSGAVVNALGVKALSIGPEIDPGVPWTRSRSGPDVALALKSGNFGTPDFFLKAWSSLA
ncbi:3-oxo-tetronate kinase [Kaistia terrae]|uniref:3-oxo-tetronate kinase n=1 Tax=Kaistia terrae TaxID=537017 RepID=A0ABW0Q1R3_9HYPH|nr:3-oxo-tetronate kinase [Kaistia terrae]MCX5578755.1 four-carbon acid sugar kinase family protein [Kaistia terrae]